MPRIRVRLFANFREYSGTRELEMECDTVADALAMLCEKFPGFEGMIFQDGNVRHYINIFLNGRNIFESGGLGKVLVHDDEIAIFPPVSGG
ncbi:MAG TPA: ubiquitin-like small modifier protein 1 [Candidatus Methanoperedens sp.]